MRRLESNCVRRITKIQLYDHVREEELRRRTGQQSVVEKIKIARWKWYGHALWLPDDRIRKQALSWRLEGRRRVGRPKDTWRRTLTRKMQQKNLLKEDVNRKAEDRTACRSFVADLRTTWDPGRIEWVCIVAWGFIRFTWRFLPFDGASNKLQVIKF